MPKKKRVDLGIIEFDHKNHIVKTQGGFRHEGKFLPDGGIEAQATDARGCGLSLQVKTVGTCELEELAKMLGIIRREDESQDTFWYRMVPIHRKWKESHAAPTAQEIGNVLAATLRGTVPPPARAQHQAKRKSTSVQDVMIRLLEYAAKTPYTGQTDKQLQKIGGCARETLRKAIGKSDQRCPVSEELAIWMSTPGRRATRQFYIHTESDLAARLQSDEGESVLDRQAGAMRDLTSHMFESEVQIYFNNLLTMFPQEQRAEMVSYDIDAKRVLVSTMLSNESYSSQYAERFENRQRIDAK